MNSEIEHGDPTLGEISVPVDNQQMTRELEYILAESDRKVKESAPTVNLTELYQAYLIRNVLREPQVSYAQILGLLHDRLSKVDESILKPVFDSLLIRVNWMKKTSQEKEKTPTGPLTPPEGYEDGK